MNNESNSSGRKTTLFPFVFIGVLLTIMAAVLEWQGSHLEKAKQNGTEYSLGDIYLTASYLASTDFDWLRDRGVVTVQDLYKLTDSPSAILAIGDIHEFNSHLDFHQKYKLGCDVQSLYITGKTLISDLENIQASIAKICN